MNVGGSVGGERRERINTEGAEEEHREKREE
jgi:hypothetical protein